MLKPFYAFGIATAAVVAAHYMLIPAANPDAPPLASMQVSGTAGAGSTWSQVSHLGAVEVRNAITDDAHIVVSPISGTPLIFSLAPPHTWLPRGPPSG
jgi:hypothetical protein